MTTTPPTTPSGTPYDGTLWPEAGAAQTGPPEPVAREWHELFRNARWGHLGWWRAPVGLLFLAALVLVVQSVPVIVYTIVLAAAGKSYDEVMDLATADPLTPAFLAVVNLGWALSIPVVLLVAFVMHRLRPGFTMSVVGRMRWRWLAACAGLALVALVANIVVSFFLPASGADSSASGALNDFTSQTRDFLIIMVLLTPLQAAGEEFVFRGYLTQALGSAFSHVGLWVARVVAVVVPATLFAIAHGIGQDAPVFLDRFVFGLVAGVLVIATGGLEAAIALHALNNLFAFGLALAFGDISGSLEPTSSSWLPLVGTVTQAVVFAALVVWLARRTDLQTRSEASILVRQTARV